MSIPVADAAKHPNPTGSRISKLRSKLDHKLDHLSSDLSKIGVAVKTTWNPNHRHDEEWEKEVDAKIEAIRDGHRYRSFAGERDGNILKWHVDGHGQLPFS
jgi:phospholipase D1/2